MYVHVHVLFSCVVNKYINNGIWGVTPRVAPNSVVAMLLATGGGGGVGRTSLVFPFQHLPKAVIFTFKL